MNSQHSQGNAPKYWQVAAGSFQRDYSDYFMRHGIAFVGEDSKGRIGEVVPGDKIALKVGKTLKAAGTVVSRGSVYTNVVQPENSTYAKGDDKPWLVDFDGWPLPAYIYVDWHRPQSPEKSFHSLDRRTFTSLGVKGIQEEVDQILMTCKEEAVEPEPPRRNPVSCKQVREFLFSKDLDSKVIDRFADIVQLAHYYKDKCWGSVSEHEARTFLVVPLLLALGWSERQLKIECPIPGRQRLDIACALDELSNKSKMDRECVMILETKRFDQGLLWADKQAKDYAKSFMKCNILVATNGFSFKIFERDKDMKFAPRHTAYLSLINLLDGDPLEPEGKGCIETLRLMMCGNRLPRLNPN